MPATATPLENFLLDYVEKTGGAWDEVEPQVYDLLLPPGEAADLDADAAGMLRVAFDPEAVPEHPGSQLASFGTPLVDRLLNDAMHRGRCAVAYRNGLNTSPHNLTGRVRRALTLPEGVELVIRRVRPMHFATAVYWFQATFTSDQKEEEILPVAVDLHHGRQVRQLEQLLDFEWLAEEPSQYLPEARRESVATAYPTARQEVVRTVAGLANVRRRELDERLQRQISRMGRYYADLRAELDEQARRAHGEQPEKFAQRRQALDREERLRVAELRQKNALRVQLRLVSLLVVHQPKLLLPAELRSSRKSAPVAELELVWDPLLEVLEAAACPQCGAPTYVLQTGRLSRLACPNCAAR